jgi:hypothetical protein
VFLLLLLLLLLLYSGAVLSAECWSYPVVHQSSG